MENSRRPGTAPGREFWKRFFISLSLSLLATAVAVSVVSLSKTLCNKAKDGEA